ncbi:uncharacterized protein M437DRAFT_11045, partial [Aureobasidium melanogenum CBS 110374]
RSCVVCFKDQPLSSFPDISHDSRHQHGANTCRTCFNRYLIQQVNAGNARARCVECQEPLRYADVKIIVSKTTLMKYDKNLLKAFVEEDVDFYYCMSAKCKSGQIHIGGEDMPIFCCKVCNHKHCMACEIPWHEGETCDQYQARHDEEIIQTEQAEALIAAVTMPCPKCKVRIEKDGGCDHMTCAQCQYEFCYQCLANYKTILAHDNRRHKRSCVYY